MDQGLTKNNKASIIHLFQKMDSNVSKFRESIISSPVQAKGEKDATRSTENNLCSCSKDEKERKLQAQFFCSQYELVSRAATFLQQEGNQTLSKLLSFMSQFLLKLCKFSERETVCECKRKKLTQNEDLHYKISFLREQNHKFFRIIQQKTLECQNLKNKLQKTLAQIQHKADENTPNANISKSRLSETSFVQGISSRIISSNSSRVSQFKHVWPQLTQLMGQGGHKRYFEPQPLDRQNYFKNKPVLFEKDLNKAQNTFRKAKIFETTFESLFKPSQ